MSAICGAWSWRGEARASALCGTMLEQLAPLGPDSMAQTSGGSPEIALGHRLFRVTPEDAFERQPLVGWAGMVVVADARIDNRTELAAELGLSSAELQVMPDSALLLATWVRWGRDCLDHLCGAFVFAAWNPDNRQLFLARDHSGERTLYYRVAQESFLFASTARAIRACPGVSSELDEAQLVRDLVGLPPQYPRTRFAEIRQIAPGHCVTVQHGSAMHRRYWDIHNLPVTQLPRDEDYADRFRELFDQAVRSRLRTIGNVASELSAGLDSGAVTATAAHLLAGDGRELRAYTSVPSPDFAGPVLPGYLADEGPAAAEVALRSRNIRHECVDSSGSDMLRELDRTYPVLDLPHTAALNAVWSNLIYDRARAAGVTVMLSGALGNFAASYTGSDILYTLFRQGRMLATLRRAVELRKLGLSSGRNAASLTLFAALPWALRRRIDPLVRAAGIEWSPLAAARDREYGALDQFRRNLFLHSSSLPRLMQTQFQNNQYGDYNNAALAGWHIDVRDPTADRRLFEYCASIPPEQFLAGRQGRSLIRRAMQGSLPESTLHRNEKGMQAADWFESLSRIRPQLAAELDRIGQSPAAQRLLDLALLHRIVAEWPATAREAWRNPALYQSVIPRGVAMGYFIRRTEAEFR